jgi:hypothetical protein
MSVGKEIECMMNSFYWGIEKVVVEVLIGWSKYNGCLNFRHIERCNFTLLGKQGWKLITNFSSLFTRIVKAKYFPESGFLDAHNGHI